MRNFLGADRKNRAAVEDRQTVASPGKGRGPRRGGRRQSHQQRPWDLSRFEVPEEEGKTRFHDLGLRLEVMHAIADLGFRYCSPIQAQVLPYTLDGYDAIGKAQTGTGKTAAFLITIFNDLLCNPDEGERWIEVELRRGRSDLAIG